MRGDFYSQEHTDRAVEYLQAVNPGLLEGLLVEEQLARMHAYFNLAFHVLDHLKEADGVEVEAPRTPVAQLDLICELSRRLRSAYGLAEALPRGTPLAAGPQAPLPPLVALAITESVHVTAMLPLEAQVLSPNSETRCETPPAAAAMVNTPVQHSCNTCGPYLDVGRRAIDTRWLRQRCANQPRALPNPGRASYGISRAEPLAG